MESSFYVPVHVYCGEGAVRAHAKDLKALGKKAFVVTGAHSAVKCGVYSDICAALNEAGMSHVWFHEVEQNPSVSTVMRARDTALEEKCDCVIGAGGGSPLDAAKAVALMMRHKDEGPGFLYASGSDNSAVPIALVPTTCGTGSEVTGVSILTVPEQEKKGSIPHKIFADLALVDGTYLMGASGRILLNTSLDALAHLFESYMSSAASKLSRMIADEGMKVWGENLQFLSELAVSEKRPELTAGRADSLMLASMLGGMAIAQTGTSLPHALSYYVTVKLGVEHGRAVNYFMPGYLKAAGMAGAAYRADMLHLMEQSGIGSVEEFRRLYDKACGPLSSDEQKLKEILKMDAAGMEKNTAKLRTVPFTVDSRMLEQIVFDAFI